MLRYAAESDFEAWLATCPLDPRALTYSVTRGGDGMLTVQCTWRQASIAVAGPTMQKQTAAPTMHNASPVAVRSAIATASAPSTASEPSASAENEADNLRKVLGQMQQMVSAHPAAAAVLASPVGSSGGGGTSCTMPSSAQAALAACLLEQRSRDSDGQPTRPSRDEIRAAIGMASGAGAFPAAPGSSAT